MVYEIEPKPRDHPSSHFRPEPDQPEIPDQTRERVEIVTPSIGDYQRASVVPSTGESKNGSESDPAGSSKEDPIQDATGTTIYVVGVICIIPAAGLVAWIVRYVVRKKVTKSLITIIKRTSKYDVIFQYLYVISLIEGLYKESIFLKCFIVERIKHMNSFLFS